MGVLAGCLEELAGELWESGAWERLRELLWGRSIAERRCSALWMRDGEEDGGSEADMFGMRRMIEGLVDRVCESAVEEKGVQMFL